MNHYNFRRRINGTRISESGLPNIIGNIRKIDIGSSLSLKNEKKYSLVSEELNHYLAFTEEEANYELRKRKFEDEEHVKLYLDENPELKNIVTTLVDSCIVYDKNNQFCTFSPNKKIYSYTENQDKLLNDLYSKHIKLLNFNKEQEAWSTFYEWIASGKANYEIIYKTITRKEKEEKVAKEKEKISLCESKLKELGRDMVSLNENKDDPSYKKKSLNNKNEIKKYKSIKTTSLNEIKRLDKNEKMIGTFQSLNEDKFLEMYNEIIEDSVSEEDFENEKVVVKKYEKVDKNKKDNELIPIEIVGIKRLLSNAVTRVDVIGENGENVPMYKAQDYRGKYYYLPQQCVIEVDWGKVSGNSRFSYKSYVDSLRRNYNLTRSLEESRVAWNILVGQFRLKMVVPTGSQIGAKAKEAVRKLVNQYKERLTISSSDGVVSVNGEKNYAFGKNIALPSRSGNTTTIDSIEYKGVDLKNMDVVNYFRDATYRDSDIPKSRFDRDNNFGNLLLFKNDGIPFDELFFYKKSKRLLNEFSKIIRLPMYYDAILRDPVLSLDDDFYNSIQIQFNADSHFELAKEQEVEKAKLNNLSAFERLQDSSREPIFSMRFLLVEKFKIISQTEWDLNKQYMEEDKESQNTP